MAATWRGQGIDRIEYTVESAAVQAAILLLLYRRSASARYDGRHVPVAERPPAWAPPPAVSG